MAAILLAPSPAGAQDSGATCFPGSSPDYPPTGGSVAIEVGLSLSSGAIDPPTQLTLSDISTLTVTGAVAGEIYCGFLFSTPVTLTPTQATASGSVTFSPKVPADFALGAIHHMDVYHNQKLAGAFDFCVTKTGAITSVKGCPEKAPAGGKGPLAKTGADRMMDVLKAAAILLAVGASVLYVRRRRLMADRRVAS